MTELTWKTKAGVEMKPGDFTDKHLLNTIKFIERMENHLRYAYIKGLLESPIGEAWYKHTDEDMPLDLDPDNKPTPLEEICPIYGAFTKRSFHQKFMTANTYKWDIGIPP